MNLAILFAFGAMIGWGFGDFLIQRTIRRIGAIETLFWITLFSSLILTPFVWREISGLGSKEWLFLIILGLVNFASGYIHLRALQIGKLSVVEIILSIELPLTVLLGVFMFNEALTLWQIILIITLFFGIVLISIDPGKVNRKDFLEKGSLLAILSGFLIALVNFGSASQAKELSPLMAVWIPWFICGLICLVFITKNSFKNFINKSRRYTTLILITVIVDLLAWVFYVYAVEKEELSITIAITESFVVIALILGVIVNKEKISRVQYFGAALAVTCSLLIAFVSK